MGYEPMTYPDGWPTGSVTGLRVRGGFEMDIEWAAGQLKQATVSCISGGTGTTAFALFEHNNTLRA
jgi:hypothetical protein